MPGIPIDEKDIMVELRHLKKSFGRQQVLKDVNLEIRRGETMVILGGSGTGKSVLLKITIGLLDVDGGEIWVDGEEVTQATEPEWMEVRKKVSYMFQWGALFDSMDVYDNVAFPLRERRLCDEDEFSWALFVGLDLRPVADTDPGPCPASAHRVDTDARGNSRQPPAEVRDARSTAGGSLTEPDPGLLDHVVGLVGRPEQSNSEKSQPAAVGLELLGQGGLVVDRHNLCCSHDKMMDADRASPP